MRHKINGQSWTITRRRGAGQDCGWCDPAAHRIYISPDLAGYELIATAIHEMLHANCPCLSDEAVDETERSTIRLLRKLKALKS